MVLVVGFDLQALAPFIVAAAVAFGLLATAEGRHSIWRGRYRSGRGILVVSCAALMEEVLKKGPWPL